MAIQRVFHQSCTGKRCSDRPVASRANTARTHYRQFCSGTAKPGADQRQYQRRSGCPLAVGRQADSELPALRASLAHPKRRSERTKKKLALGSCGWSRPQVQVNGLQPRPARHGGRRTEAEPRAPPSILSAPAGAVPGSSRRRFPGAASGPGAGLGQGDDSSAGKGAGCSGSSRRGEAGTPGEGHRAGPAAPAIPRRLPALRLPPREPPRLSEPPGAGGSEQRPAGEGKGTAAARAPTSPLLSSPLLAWPPLSPSGRALAPAAASPALSLIHI